uniref:27 kDa protein n=1 Tax=White ash mosaic virus TaxID=375547 RepID=Q1WAJ5_9VIRU|nr:27 kDa protein [White ash mosaic virus]
MISRRTPSSSTLSCGKPNTLGYLSLSETAINSCKCNARTFAGKLAIMRLTGEGPTFDANTECNIAYDALRFKLTKGKKACYAGDDLAREECAEERSSWAYLNPSFKLTAKPIETTRPDFCGWRITKEGIVKQPRQLYQSLVLGFLRGNIASMIPSYKIDFTYAYKMGDKLFEIFDEDDLSCHQATVRLLHKKGVKLDISTDDEHVSNEEPPSDRLLSFEVEESKPIRLHTSPLEAWLSKQSHL